MSGKIPLAIIEALQRNPKLTISDLATQINVSSRTIERQIKKLQQQGVLKRIGSTKTGYWEVEASVSPLQSFN
jgi:ATP-dependent DNA helicase RecG